MTKFQQDLGALFAFLFILMLAMLGGAVGYNVIDHAWSGFWLGFGATITLLGGLMAIVWLAIFVKTKGD